MLKRSEKLRFYELSDDEYEVGIFDDYLSQVAGVHRHQLKLIDLKLERNVEEAELTARQVQDGNDLLEALLCEVKAIINRHYREHFGPDGPKSESESES